MPLNIDWQQILLHLLNFAILFGGLYFLLYKPVKQFMGKRQAMYEARERETLQMKNEAAALKNKYESKLKEAERSIRERREQVSEELEAERQRQLAEARAEARKIINTAKKTADMRSSKALEDAREEIRTLAIGTVEKLVLTGGGDALDRFLDEAESERSDG